jgi:hypothetical protein
MDCLVKAFKTHQAAVDFDSGKLMSLPAIYVAIAKDKK